MGIRDRHDWRIAPSLFWIGMLLGLIPITSSRAPAAVVTMKSGFQFEGHVGRIGSLGDNPLNPSNSGTETGGQPVVIIDDNLRRTYVSYSQVASIAESPPSATERIKLNQRVEEGSHRVVSVGPILGITPFDKWGHRIFSMKDAARGTVHVIQGITEVTPHYMRVESLQVDNGSVWDMRVNPHSIPRAKLSEILMQYLDPHDADERLRVVQLYIQSQRYLDAIVELEGVMEDFEDLDHLGEQADALLQHLATYTLREISFRQKAGQHQRVNSLLSSFPKEGIAGETLLQVRDMLGEYEKQKQQYDHILEELRKHIDAIEDAGMRAEVDPIYEELEKDLSVHSLNRMADYLRLSDDVSMKPDQKVALAVSGWLLGSGEAIGNLAVATSLKEVRDKVVAYLRAKHHHERQAILENIEGLEGGTPRYISKILENIRPPLGVEEDPQSNADQPAIPGLYEFTIPGLGPDAKITYYLQLPPEYHPDRRYPCVVTLNGTGSSELVQIDWWAGGFNQQSKLREGQASRRGYIVLAPKWLGPSQADYAYTAREHAAVLSSLRHAVQRFSIDTDRVFLSGHSAGGAAAWDIGIAHPDLWAGVIPIVARADGYIRYYTENARRLPMYFVGGELDANWLRYEENVREFDRYMRLANYDCTIVEYRGRGHEHFQDEVQRIFDWMDLRSHRRNFFPKEIGRPSFQEGVATMRLWDNFFWWIELADLPSPSIVHPAEWPPDRGTRPVETFGKISGSNRILVTTRARALTVWLSPRMIDFDRPAGVRVNGDEIRAEIAPNLEVLLEDVRMRADRLNPFWAKVTWPERGR